MTSSEISFEPGWDPQNPPPHRSLSDALVIHLNVVGALLLRETRTRFGRHRLGFLWAFLQPMMAVGVLALVFAAFGRDAVAGLSLPMFLVTGFVPWMMFNNTYSRVMTSGSGNQPLLAFPQVTRFDCQWARGLLELAVHLTIVAVLVTALVAAGSRVSLGHLDTAALCLLLVWLTGYGLGAIIGVVVVFLPSVEHVMAALIRLLFFTSGVFFTPHELPPKLRELLLYNPLLNLVTGLRDQLTADDLWRDVDMPYTLLVVGVLLLLGLLAETSVKKRG